LKTCHHEKDERAIDRSRKDKGASECGEADFQAPGDRNGEFESIMVNKRSEARYAPLKADT
jgi:hypothetical protein